MWIDFLHLVKYLIFVLVNLDGIVVTWGNRCTFAYYVLCPFLSIPLVNRLSTQTVIIKKIIVNWKACRCYMHSYIWNLMKVFKKSIYQTAFSLILAEHSILYPWNLNLVYIIKWARVKWRFSYRKWAELGVYYFLQQLIRCHMVLCYSCNSSCS